MLIFGADRELKRWAGERLGIEDFGPAVAIGVERNGKIVAVAVFNQYHPPSIQITFVRSSQNWATRNAIRGILGYPFIQLKCKRVSAVADAKNQLARAFLCRLGFHQEGYHPDALPSGDAVTYGMLAKDAARWLAEGKYVERLATSADRAGPDRDYRGADAIQYRDRECEPHELGNANRIVAMVARP